MKEIALGLLGFVLVMLGCCALGASGQQVERGNIAAGKVPTPEPDQAKDLITEGGRFALGGFVAVLAGLALILIAQH